MASDFERLGGEAKLRPLIDEFVDRVMGDLMIGFHFRAVSRERLREMEYQHAAAHLGGPVDYGGRPMRAAHAKHRIMGGQFERRKKILSDVFEKHGVPEDIRERWIAHVESLRAEVTADPGSECR